MRIAQSLGIPLHIPITAEDSLSNFLQTVLACLEDFVNSQVVDALFDTAEVANSVVDCASQGLDPAALDLATWQNQLGCAPRSALTAIAEGLANQAVPKLALAGLLEIDPPPSSGRYLAE